MYFFLYLENLLSVLHNTIGKIDDWQNNDV